MKIVIIQGAFLPVPPLQGGAVEKIWYKMGLKFAQLGCEVTHIGKKTEDLLQEETINNVTYVRVKGYEISKSLLKLKVLDFFYSLRAIKKIPNDADIIISNTFWAPILLRRKKKSKVYVSVERMPKWQIKFYTHVFRLRANSTPVSEAIKKQISERFHHLVTMIPNPLPYESDISSFSYEKKEQVILYVGRVHPEKGLDLLIKAFQKLEISYSLRIVGPWDVASGGGGSDYKKYLDDLVQDNPNINFVGSIFDEDELNDEYRRAAIFVYPSVAEKGETFGLAPLEAMSWGCVPIVSSLSCFLDFIVDKENGFVFNYKDENAVTLISNYINLLVGDEELRKRIAAKAICVNYSHSIDNIAQSFLKDFSNK